MFSRYVERIGTLYLVDTANFAATSLTCSFTTCSHTNVFTQHALLQLTVEVRMRTYSWFVFMENTVHRASRTLPAAMDGRASSTAPRSGALGALDYRYLAHARRGRLIKMAWCGARKLGRKGANYKRFKV